MEKRTKARLPQRGTSCLLRGDGKFLDNHCIPQALSSERKRRFKLALGLSSRAKARALTKTTSVVVNSGGPSHSPRDDPARARASNYGSIGGRMFYCFAGVDAAPSLLWRTL